MFGDEELRVLEVHIDFLLGTFGWEKFPQADSPLLMVWQFGCRISMGIIVQGVHTIPGLLETWLEFEQTERAGFLHL